NWMLGKRNRARPIALLLPPREAETVTFLRSHHVHQTVAVHVVAAQFRAAGSTLRGAPAAERRCVVLPRSRHAFRRLFPPAIRVEEVHASVAIDVGDTQAVPDVYAPRT